MVCLIYLLSLKELEAMKRRVKEMEEEAAKLREMQAQVEKEMSASGNDRKLHLKLKSVANIPLYLGDTADVDGRSVYVGNVDYGSTPEELQTHFQSCGVINRITIVCDKWTGNPKGFAYIEFADPSHVANATALNESLFRQRPLKVVPKRTNIPGFNARGRGRGAPYRGGYFAGGFRGAPRGGRGARRGGFYQPY
jgi:polyadenylate-binding protein 2